MIKYKRASKKKWRHKVTNNIHEEKVKKKNLIEERR